MDTSQRQSVVSFYLCVKKRQQSPKFALNIRQFWTRTQVLVTIVHSGGVIIVLLGNLVVDIAAVSLDPQVVCTVSGQDTIRSPTVHLLNMGMRDSERGLLIALAFVVW
jgi:hypothetical protein